MQTIVFDANSLYARSWFASQRMTAEPREALGLALNTAIQLLNPETGRIGQFFDTTLFAWDGQQNKDKNREAKPQVYHDTKLVLKDILELLFGTVNVEHPDGEGDDVVATVVTNLKPTDSVCVVSGDKDLMQLCSQQCQYYSLNDKAVLSRSLIKHKFHGIKRPSQVAIELAIIGDPVDNISGVRGYGPVKCKQLFQQVTEDMSFMDAVKAITGQLPKARETEFWSALERTLLKNDLSGLPAPAKLTLLPPKEVETLGLPQIRQNYRALYEVYR